MSGFARLKTAGWMEAWLSTTAGSTSRDFLTYSSNRIFSLACQVPDIKLVLSSRSLLVIAIVQWLLLIFKGGHTSLKMSDSNKESKNSDFSEAWWRLLRLWGMWTTHHLCSFRELLEGFFSHRMMVFIRMKKFCQPSKIWHRLLSLHLHPLYVLI